MQTYNLTYRQEAIWLEDELHSQIPVNNVLTKVTFSGSVDETSFYRAFKKLCHDLQLLRTVVDIDKATGKRMMVVQEDSGDLEVINSEDTKQENFEKSGFFQDWCRHAFSYGDILYKAILVKFSNEECCFYINIHHSIVDGYSCQLIINRLTALYEMEIGAKSEETVPYDDGFFRFSSEHVDYRNSPVYQAKEDYWRSKFESPVEPIQFYSNNTLLKTARTIRLERKLDDDISYLISDREFSPSLVFTTVLFAFLHRVSLNRDVSVGSPLLNRSDKYASSVGLFMTVCPNRISVDSDDTFDTLIKKVQAEISEIRDYRDHFVSSRKAGYEVLLNIHSPSPGSFLGMPAKYELTTPANLIDELDGDEPNQSWVGKESLAIQVHHNDNGYVLCFDFNYGVWQQALLRERAVDHFCILLRKFFENRFKKLSEIELLTINEKALLLPDEVNARIQGTFPPSIIDLFLKQVSYTPDKTAVKYNDIELSYSMLARDVDQLAEQLSRLGVQAGVLVGVCLDRSERMVVALLAVLRSGGAYVPIDPKQPSDRIALILEDAQPLVLLTEKKLAHKVEGGAKTLICLDDNAAYRNDNGLWEFATVTGEDLAYVIFTSGSTGRPKGVSVLHHGLTTFLQAMSDMPGMTEDDVILSVTTISFDIAALELFLPLIVGATVRIVPYEVSINGEKLSQTLIRENITFFQATPATYRMLLASEWTGNRNIKLLCGGEALPYELAQQLIPRCGSLWNMYGPTETTIWSSVHKVAATDDHISIGRAIQGTQLYVLNEALSPVPIGVPGELYITGDGVAQGYFRNKPLTEERFLINSFSKVANSRMYKTGDLVRYRQDMSLEYIGRIDFQVKVRGFRIEIGEIETLLGSHESVAQCVVTTWPDISGEQTLIAYLVAPQGEELDVKSIRDYLKSKLPDYMIPAKFVSVESFPLTHNGKVDRKRLPPPESSSVMSAKDEFLAPRNDFEQSLAAVWQTMLKLPNEVGITDNFFDLGGDSLATVALVNEMEKATGIKFDIGDIFSYPTIGQLVEAQGDNVRKMASSVVPLQAEGNGTPLFCLCGINLYKDLAFSLGKEQPVFGIYASEEQAYLENALAGKTSDISIDKLAQAYFDAICRQQPDGPYQLAGISFGGLLALETAKLLKKDNKEVKLIILLDTILPIAIQRSLYGKVKKSLKDSLIGIRATINNIFSREENDANVDMAHLREQAFIKCMEAYQHSEDVYDGQVILFKANDHRSWGTGVSFLPDYGWKRFLKNELIVHNIDGNHLGIIKQPHVEQLTKILHPYLQ